MEMKGERLIPAPRQKVWDALNDPEVLKQCIPGCETLEKTGDNELRATASIKIGPIGAKFGGKVQLTDLDPPTSYRISGEGQGGVAGFAKGGANVNLADEAGGTRLSYVVNAQVGGKIAQLGARLIDATSKQMADIFFDRFSMLVAPPPAATPLETVAPAAASPVASPGVVMVDDTAASIATDGPIGAIAAMTGSAASTARPAHAPLQPAKMPKVSMWDLIPAEPFGFPRIAIIGFVLWLMVLFLVFKTYVGL